MTTLDTDTSRGYCGQPRARVLFVTCHLPFPPLSGGRRRELELIRRLARRHDVHVVAASKTFAEDRANADALRELCRAVEVFPTLPLPEAPRGEDAPLQVLRHRSPALTSRVSELLDRGGIDLVHAEGFYLMQHVPDDAAAPVLLVEQNVEFELWRQRAAAAEPDAKRLDTRREYLTTRAAELEAWKRADLVAALTPEDRELIAAAAPGTRVAVLPDGADHVPGPERAVEPTARGPAPLAVFVSNFGYAPNVDAARHLCCDVLPLVRERVPDAQVWLVGNAPPAEVRELAGPGVVVTGRVPDVLPYVEAADVVVCPLRIGGGIKVKALEALRRAKAVVSTSVGVQGLAPQTREGLVVADGAAAFAQAAARLLTDAAERRELERRAALAGAALPRWDDAAEAAAAIYDELLRGAVPAAGARRVQGART